MVTKQDFLKNSKMVNVTKGWLSALFCGEAVVYTLELSWKKMNVNDDNDDLYFYETKCDNNHIIRKKQTESRSNNSIILACLQTNLFDQTANTK